MKEAIRVTMGVSFLLLPISSANAAVSYILAANDGLQSASFTLTLDEYIRPVTVFPYSLEPYPDAYKAMGEAFSSAEANCVASFTYRPGSCAAVLFALDVRYRDIPNRRDDVIAIKFNDGGAGFIYFDAGAFSSPGQYVSKSGYTSGTLSVINSSAVPEPAAWAMMLLGFGFVGGALRSAKRRQKLTVSYG